MNIRDRFADRRIAERYRDRFRTGRRRRTHEREAAALDRLLDLLGPLDSALDAPSGAGRFATTLARHARHVIQTDASFHMLSLGREDHPFLADTGGQVLADVQQLPLADASVDLVFCHRLLNHVHDPLVRLEMMRELARVARRFLIVSALTPPRLIQVIRRTYRRWTTREAVDKYISPEDLRDAASKLGLRNSHCVKIPGAFRAAAFLTFEK